MTIEPPKVRRAKRPPLIVIYGPPGTGKTTLASEFPDPVFLFTEEGQGELELATFGDVLTSYQHVAEALSWLAEYDHEFETVVIDSLDWLEPLVWAETARRFGLRSVDEPNMYGRGYLKADIVWREFLQLLENLRSEEMTVILLAHEQITAFNDPDAIEAYDRGSVKLHKRAAAMIIEAATIVGFLDRKKAFRAGEGKTGARVEKSKRRVLHLDGGAGRVTKARIAGDDTTIEIKKGEGFNALAERVSYFRRKYK